MSKNTKLSIIFLLVFSIGFVLSTGFLYYALFNPIGMVYHTTILIDPGHGGDDVGAIGYDGSSEKDINLEISKKIGDMISKMDPSIKVLYTREEDTITWSEEENLQKRVQSASSLKADYFISIHCSSSQNTDAKGFSFHIRNTDAISDRVARKASDTLKTFRWSSSQGIGYSTDQSLSIVDNLEIPAILFEMGFITNQKECSRLQKWYNQQLIAYAIANAYVDTIKDLKKAN